MTSASKHKVEIDAAARQIIADLPEWLMHSNVRQAVAGAAYREAVRRLGQIDASRSKVKMRSEVATALGYEVASTKCV